MLLEHGRVLPYRPPRVRSVKRPWPDWVDYRPRQVWGYDLTALPGRRHRRVGDPRPRLAQVDRHDALPGGHRPAGQAAVHARAGGRGPDAAGPRASPTQPAEDRRPVLLAVSDNGPQMTSGSTREFMALHAIATHYGRPGTPTDQAHIESLFGHVKYDWPHLCHLTDPGDLARELDAARDAVQQRAPARRHRLRHARRRTRGPRPADPRRPPPRPATRARRPHRLPPPAEARRMTAAVIPGRSPAHLTSRISAATPGCQGQPDRAEPATACARHVV